MILKLFKLNKSKLEQNMAFRQEVYTKIFDIEDKIEQIDEDLVKTSVNRFGAIGDFKVLAIHKNTMKYEKQKLLTNRNTLTNEIKNYDSIIIKYQKELEKYQYLLNEEKKQKLKEIIKYDEKNSNEYVQAKFAKDIKEII